MIRQNVRMLGWGEGSFVLFSLLLFLYRKGEKIVFLFLYLFLNDFFQEDGNQYESYRNVVYVDAVSFQRIFSVRTVQVCPSLNVCSSLSVFVAFTTTYANVSLVLQTDRSLTCFSLFSHNATSPRQTGHPAQASCQKRCAEPLKRVTCSGDS